MSPKSIKKVIWLILLALTAQGLLASVPPAKMHPDTPENHMQQHCAAKGSSLQADQPDPHHHALEQSQKPKMDHSNCASQCLCCLSFCSSAMVSTGFSQPVQHQANPELELATLPATRLADFHFRPPILI